ncbi:hypothetical protein ARAM_006409 [Aspergillus rambellii]|uniref:Major facilitator superfamily (MFS) profile domain-containing protein n=1 Tax=Aspergillus rambellii TaxID=308745 RepID=A0A0F8X7N3_9EURO|nr:hypothetical protein ARAM_006409 [Aspergillus rambellii]
MTSEKPRPLERGRSSAEEIQHVASSAVSSSSTSPSLSLSQKDPGDPASDATKEPSPSTAAAAAAAATKDTEKETEATPATTEEQPQVYSTFSKAQTRMIVAMVTLASFFSPLSGQIYYPVMPTLVKSYHLTPALINLTITTYMILQGLAPSFMGTFADSGGRRPAYIIAFTIYTAANIGLALQNSYAALMILRCIQSAGSSGTISFGYGVIADIATPAERGTYIGPMAAGVMVAPALGPVIGGILAKFLGWRSVFWFLVIISGGFLVVFVLLVPETARRIVGDGSVLPAEWWRRSVLQWWQLRSHAALTRPNSDGHPDVDVDASRSAAGQPGGSAARSKLRFPNPLKSFVILLEPDALILISYIGVVMFANIALLTSTPTLFTKIYGFNDLQIGLCFLPLGAGASLGAIINGKILDRNYRRYCTLLSVPLDRKRNTDLRNFPIEKARLEPFLCIILLAIVTYTPYGWVLQQRAPLAAPLILQFILGFSMIASTNTLNTLLIDLFPDRPATASAACNLVRCWLGAVGAAVIDYMLSGMGWGWCFTFLGLVMLLSLGLVYVEFLYGMKWREKRRVRREEREKERRDLEADKGVA